MTSDKPCILIDPGHGGKDPGASSSIPIEAYINFRIAKKLQAYLRAKGFEPPLTRRGHDQTVDLEERVMIERAIEPMATISIHCNAYRQPQPHGFEIWTSPGETESDRLATTIFRAYRRRWPSNDVRSDLSDGDPDKESRFRILTGTKGPAVLVELGFVTNPHELSWLLHDHTQEQLAINLGEAIIDWHTIVNSVAS